MQPSDPVCLTCKTPVFWQDCPTGGWWIHEKHPEDHHDAETDYDLEFDDES